MGAPCGVFVRVRRAFLILNVIVPVVGAATPIDLQGGIGWFDDPDADELMTKTLLAKGSLGLTVLTPTNLLSHPAIFAWSAVCPRPEFCHSADARSPPHAPSVLIRYNPVELLIYVDTRPEATSIDALVAESACPYLRAEEIPLPVPYTVWVVQRSGESKHYVPEHKPIARGVLSRCPAR